MTTNSKNQITGMKRLFAIIFLAGLNYAGYAQELTFGADLFSRYIWRGVDFSGNSPSLQPWATFKTGNETHSFSVGLWSAFSLANSTNEEADLFVNYTFKNRIGITLTDYPFQKHRNKDQSGIYLNK